MKALILAAGYATRLYPLTLNIPKPLLMVGKKRIIEHILDKLNLVDNLSEVFVVTNQKFYENFCDWAKKYSFKCPIKIINDKTTNNDNRLGAIADIELVIKEKNINDDLIVLGGDNLFDFELRDFVEFAKSKQAVCIAVHDVKDKNKAKLYGIVDISGDSKIINFLEKPQEPPSTLASTCIYFFPKDTVKFIPQYVKENVSKKDAPGYYIAWVSSKHIAYAYSFKGDWYDIGDIESLKHVQKKYGE